MFYQALESGGRKAQVRENAWKGRREKVKEQAGKGVKWIGFRRRKNEIKGDSEQAFV